MQIVICQVEIAFVTRDWEGTRALAAPDSDISFSEIILEPIKPDHQKQVLANC